MAARKEREALRDMRVWARTRAKLVCIYAEDGAYHSAARVARELADALQAHADHVDRLLAALVRAP